MARKQKTQPQVLSGSPNPQFTDYAPEPIESTRAPTTADVGYAFGQLWVNTSTGIIYGLGAVSGGSATWNLLSPGASDVDTLTGDGGGAISPAGGNITLAGGTNITTSGAGSTITFNLDAAITLATSVTSALYTAAAGTDLLITAPVGQDIIMKMGDAAAANKVSFTDTGDVEVASIDSNGALTFGAITFTGLLTASASATIETAGTALNLGSDNDAGAVNLGVGTTARAISIGSSAAAHTITIGTVTGAASLDLLCGTGNFTLEGNVASTYDISNTGVNTGTVNIAGGTGARAINIGAGGTGAKTIGIGADASADVITIGDTTGAGSLDLVCGTGNFTLEGNIASTYNISATGANTGTCTFGAGTGARIVNLGTGGTGVKTINVGTAAIGNIITIGTVTDAASLDLICGTGNFTLEGDVASTYDISNTGVNTGTVNIAGGTGARTITIGGGGTGAKTINMGAAASADLITIGDATGAGSLDLVCGTGNFTLEGNVATTYDISGTGVNTGTITIGGGTGAQTLNVMNSTGVKTVNLASGAAANVVTLGSTTGAASLTLQAGTGEITVTGTVKEITSEFTTRSGDSVTFTQSPVMSTAANTGGVPTGATGDVNIMSLQEGIIMEQFIIGAGQTIIAPRMDGTGLSCALDLVITEGVEYNFGAARTNSRHAFTIGTSAAFFFEVQFNIEDMSACNPFVIGFRKSEANNATFADYTDYGTIGMNSGTSATEIVIMDELNSGGQTITNTTDVWGGDGTANTLRVLVSSAGVVTYTINGAAPSATNALTFDNADVVVPFMHFVQSGDLSECHLISMKVGFTA